MPNFRRTRVPGGTYFFTVNLADADRRTLIEHIDLLRHAYALTQRQRPFRTDAVVVLPNHLHAIWTLPAGDADYSTRWGAIKSRFTRAVKGRMGFNPILRSPSKVRKGDAGIWQRRYWEHRIRDRADFRRHLEYCWGNPVMHGIADRAADWPYSSIHRDIRTGAVDPGWHWAAHQGSFGE